jgi:hypothetical protein
LRAARIALLQAGSCMTPPAHSTLAQCLGIANKRLPCCSSFHGIFTIFLAFFEDTATTFQLPPPTAIASTIDIPSATLILPYVCFSIFTLQRP